MEKNRKFAVILSGCGNMDGSEIHESTTSLLAISNNQGTYSCFAPNINFPEIDFINKQATGNIRNVLMESARIARGKIQDLKAYNADEFDALVIPGGLGAIKNLCNFEQYGFQCEVNEDVKRAVIATHEQNKPIIGLCIAPILIAKILPKIKITIGNDSDLNEQIHSINCQTEDTDATGICIDEENKIITTPCYMLANSISEVATGVDKAVKASFKLML